MRRALIPLSAVGAALLAAGVGWAFAERDARPPVVASTLLGGGSLLCLGTVCAMLRVERQPAGLEVPEGVSLPAPHWAAPVALVGLCDLVGGLWASPALAVVGGLLLVLAGIGWGLTLQRRSSQRPTGGPDRATVVAARHIVDFGRRHAGDTPDVVLQHLGRDAVRIIVVAADGAYGDVVVRGMDRARAAAALAGARVHDEFSRELGAHVRTGRYEWSRMAGSQLRGGEPGS